MNSKVFHRTRRMIFWQSCPNICSKHPKLFSSESETNRKLKIFAKIFSTNCFLWTRRMQFRQLWHFLNKILTICHLKNDKIWKTKKNSKRKPQLENFIWTCKIQFRQSLQKENAQKQKLLYGDLRKKVLKRDFFEKFNGTFWYCLYVQVESTFEISLEIFLQKVR